MAATAPRGPPNDRLGQASAPGRVIGLRPYAHQPTATTAGAGRLSLLQRTHRKARGNQRKPMATSARVGKPPRAPLHAARGPWAARNGAAARLSALPVGEPPGRRSSGAAGAWLHGRRHDPGRVEHVPAVTWLPCRDLGVWPEHRLQAQVCTGAGAESPFPAPSPPPQGERDRLESGRCLRFLHGAQRARMHSNRGVAGQPDAILGGQRQGADRRAGALPLFRPSDGPDRARRQRPLQGAQVAATDAVHLHLLDDGRDRAAEFRTARRRARDSTRTSGCRAATSASASTRR